MKRVRSNPIISFPEHTPQIIYSITEDLEKCISSSSLLSSSKHPPPPGFSFSSLPKRGTSSSHKSVSFVYMTSCDLPSNVDIYNQRPVLVCMFDPVSLSSSDIYSLGLKLFSHRYLFIFVSSVPRHIWFGIPNEYEPYVRSMLYHFSSPFPFLSRVFISTTISSLSPPVPPSRTVKLMCNWMNSEELCSCWQKMSQANNMKWNHLSFVSNTLTADYYVIINRPPNSHVYYDPSKTMVFRMEPDTGTNPYWSNWFSSSSDFMYFLDLERFRNNSEWHLSKTYSELKDGYIVKTHNRISSVMSSLYTMEGHKLRINFLKYMEAQKDPDIHLDIYGKNNNFQFRTYRGELPYHQKDAGILPYKYTFIAENCSTSNYFTEKIIDAILGECLCFYWGCSNLDTFLHPMSYIRLDLTNPEQSFQTIKQCIMSHEWECRIAYIRQEKQKILSHYSFFPRVEGLIYTSELNIIVTNQDLVKEIQPLFSKQSVQVCSEPSGIVDSLSSSSRDTLVISNHVFPNFVDCVSFVVRILYTIRLPFSHIYLSRLQNVMKSSFPYPEDYFTKLSPDTNSPSSETCPFVLYRHHSGSFSERYNLRIPSL